MSKSPQNQNETDEQEANKRRDEALKRALRTPPKPHKRKKDEDNERGDKEDREGSA